MGIIKSVIAFFAVMATGLSLAADIKPASPSSQFMATVSPIVSRLQNVRYFKVGDNIIGVSAVNPLASTAAGRDVIMFFDASGQYLIAGQVLDWKENTNITAAAVKKYAPGTALAASGQAAQKEMDENTKRYKEALDKDVAEQRANMQKMNPEKAKVLRVVESGLPLIKYGAGEQRLIIFSDLSCQACMKATKELMAFAEGEGRSTWTVGIVLTANPKNSESVTNTSMIYGSKNQEAALKAFLKGNLVKDMGLVARGEPYLDAAQSATKELSLKTLPYFIINDKKGFRTMTGYNSLNGLVK